MVTSVVVLQIFLLLLPGFCTQKIKAKIATLKASTDLDRITDALVYSLLKDRKSTRLNSSHIQKSRMPSSA